jgi:O-antigen ligase
MSRAAWVALAAGAGALAFAAGRRRARLAVPAAAAVALALVLLNPSLRQRLAHAADPQENADRGTIWSVCAAVVKDHPIAGVGFGNLPRRSLPYYERIAPLYPLRAWCHDAFFSAWAEGGPILLGGLLLYWAGLFRAFARRRREAPPGPEGELARAAAAGALAALVAMLLNSLAHDIFYASESMYGLGFALGLAAVLSRPAGVPPPAGESPAA